MKRLKFTLLFLITLAGIPTVSIFAEPGMKSGQLTVYQFDIKEEISPGAARKVSRAMQEARDAKADLILIHMNTYGGLLDAADSIRTLLLNSPIPVYVFIDNNAASAGALISIACTKIYMRQGASIGAATVVTENAEALPDKYQSYMRSMMRSTAEARGRDPRIAEAMVDARIAVPGVNDSGKVLTLTASEAMLHGYCNGLAENEREVLQQAGYNDYKIIRFEASWLDNFIGWLMHPAVSGVLILLMLGGLYYELQHPGIGLPLMVALGAAVLYFAPLYLEGLAQNWEILVALAGLILIALEIFVVPGFGLTGISGGLLLLFGLMTSLLRNDGLDYSGVSGYAFAESLAVVLTGMAGALALFLFASRIFSESPVFKKMVLANEMNSAAGYSAAIDLPTPGARGVTTTLLRPSGKVKIGEHQYTASSESGFIEAGVEIEVVAVVGGNLVVRK
ncbi:MAG: NfeD family protein [Bacteroidia bacterium]